jgi:hypothetical protein
MKRIRITAALVLCAGVFFAASPAAAWTCTAKNASGARYVALGLLRLTTQARAIFYCQLSSAAPKTCVIVKCDLP